MDSIECSKGSQDFCKLLQALPRLHYRLCRNTFCLTACALELWFCLPWLPFQEKVIYEYVTHWGNVRLILGLYKNNGKENGNYYIIILGL